MNFARIEIAGICAFLIFQTAAPAATNLAFDKETAHELVRHIEKSIPTGWKVSFDPDTAWIGIDKQEKIKAFNSLPNGPADGEEKPQLTSFGYALCIAPYLSAEEYAQLSRKNRRVEAELQTLRSKLHKVSAKDGHYLASTEQEKPLVERYNALMDLQHDLPQYHFKDISLNWGTPIMYGSEIASISGDIPEDKQVREECKAVREQVEALLTRYSD